MRRLAVSALLLGIIGPLGTLALIRPASAAPAPFARYALTVSGAGLTGSGTVDAGGGLLLTDQGTATVSGRLDEAPSADARAVAAEPGTTYRTLVGAENLDPLAAPEAHAIYPGGDATQSDTTIGSESATVTPTTAAADATSPNGATATERLSADVNKQTLSAVASVASGDVTIAGVLLLHSVIGTASVTRSGGATTPAASVSPVSGTVGGIPITIDSSGVHSPTPVDAPLATAGISFSVLAPVTSSSDKGAVADSGGLLVRVKQADTGLGGAGGVSTGVDVSLLLGKVVVTESNGPALSLVTPLEESPAPEPSPSPAHRSASLSPSPPSPVATAVLPPVQPPTLPAAAPPVQTAPGPQVAAPVAIAQTRSTLELLGHRVRTTAVLAGLGAWQLLTLGTSAGALLLSRARTGDEEEHLCPC